MTAIKGDKLLRVKGVLNVEGESEPLVIHGVHRTFQTPNSLAGWPDTDWRSRPVFITIATSTARRPSSSWQET